MTNELERVGQSCKDLIINSARLKTRSECSVDCHDAVEGSGFGLGDEFQTLDCLGLDDFCDVLNLLPGIVGARKKGWRQWLDGCGRLQWELVCFFWVGMKGRLWQCNAVLHSQFNLAQKEDLGPLRRGAHDSYMRWLVVGRLATQELRLVLVLWR